VSFGSRLKEARSRKRLTQAEVAKILGIDDTTISKYENDKSEPDNETLKKLLTLYGVNWGFVLDEKQKEVSAIEETEFQKEKRHYSNLIANIQDPVKKAQAIAYLEFLANPPTDGDKK